MKARFLFLIMVSFVVFWSCEPNEPDSVLINNAPVVPSQTFTVPENFPDGKLIGAIKATDKDEDALEFSLIQESSGLFEMAKNGNLFLATNKKLSYEGKEEHNLSVYVHDGTVGRSGSITIKVTPEVSEDELPAENEPPMAENQEFEVNEDIGVDEVIGTVVATDPEEDALIYTIVENDDDLFIVSDSGELTLAEGMELDFETKEQYLLTIGVADGLNMPVEITVTVTVLDINEVPTVTDQEFTVDEDITVDEVIGTLLATDPEEDALTFTITENDGDLFAISGSGELTLAEGMQLDFETKESHTLTLEVGDGINDSVSFMVTVNVNNVFETLAEDPASFITTWNVETDGQELIIGTNSNFDGYDYTIDWGDGTIEQITTNESPSHVYENADTYTVAINGQFPALYMGDADVLSQEALVDVVQWGSQQWQSMAYAFFNCTNLESFSASDLPDLTQTETIALMFYNAIAFNGDLSQWEVGNVVDMLGVFSGATNFNGDLSNWDVGNVTIMTGMFREASSFDQDISNWNVLNVTHMDSMFRDAVSFNQDISGWTVSSVTTMFSMFNGATNFNQNLGAWEVLSISSMASMFNNSGMSSFNYSATLRGWASLGDENIPDGISLGAGLISYCNDPDTIAAREDVLETKNGWNITDGGAAPCN